MKRFKELIVPILYILLILILAVVGRNAQAQDKVIVDRWRLDKAVHELILLDSIMKDYQQKDSVTAELKELVATLKSDINELTGAYNEKVIQVDMLHHIQDGYIRERDTWQYAYSRERKKRFALTGGVYAGLSVNGKIYFGPGLGISYSLYKF